jgi:hypothetical protein
MLTRRDCLKYTALAGAGLTIQPGLLQALEGSRVCCKRLRAAN